MMMVSTTERALLLLGVVLLFVSMTFVREVEGGYSTDRVLLRDVQVLTLYKGRYTEGRRSRVPQLQCVGGTAGCSAFVPKVVQCYNRGSDGSDVQWECKTDMDNAYRFGEISVNCEGYNYPDDEFVLKGSCGLEYHLDLTKEGYEQSGHRQHNYHTTTNKEGYMSSFGSLVLLAVVCTVVYIVYQTYLSPRQGAPPTYTESTSPPPYSAPPPPGFRSEYMPPPTTDSTFTSSHSSHPYGFQPHQSNFGYGSPGYAGSAGGGGPGFWSGAATGGVLGYLFGSRSSHPTNYQQVPHPTSNTWGSTSWASGFSGYTGSSNHSSSSSASTGTRTASGFGGTRRR